ncbi:UDP-glycosyltransferase 79B8 [Hibiscus syriacus]|uniref:UDP-glycosyltransferase 79B8 n=1 Tax=Hibiscus syriacus TaxID=106335 RepID=A0A6A2XWI5_HIBSY|nr:UDP-glycosyltransferase 79B8 [Hibiscus syriacus]
MSMAYNTKIVAKETTAEEASEMPVGYPSSTVRFKADEAPIVLFKTGFREWIDVLRKDKDYCWPCLPETKTSMLDEKWVNWLSRFESGSVVFCSFGSQNQLLKDEFQELVLGFELSGLPFLVALKPPEGCSTVEEGLPDGFQERVKVRGLVYGGWVQQELLLHHPNIGCFVNHCGYGTMWEFLLSDCQIVLIPEIADQILNTRLMVNELKIGVEVERGKSKPSSL